MQLQFSVYPILNGWHRRQINQAHPRQFSAAFPEQWKVVKGKEWVWFSAQIRGTVGLSAWEGTRGKGYRTVKR